MALDLYNFEGILSLKPMQTCPSHWKIHCMVKRKTALSFQATVEKLDFSFFFKRLLWACVIRQTCPRGFLAL